MFFKSCPIFVSTAFFSQLCMYNNYVLTKVLSNLSKIVVVVDLVVVSITVSPCNSMLLRWQQISRALSHKDNSLFWRITFFPLSLLPENSSVSSSSAKRISIVFSTFLDLSTVLFKIGNKGLSNSQALGFEHSYPLEMIWWYFYINSLIQYQKFVFKIAMN